MKKKLLVGLGFVLCLSMMACGSIDDSGDKGRNRDAIEDDNDDSARKSRKNKKSDNEESDKDTEKKDKDGEKKKDKEKDKEKDDKDEKKEDKEKDDKEEKDKKDKEDEDKNSKKPSKSDDELSDDLYDYQISIDGTVINLPCSIDQVEDLGFKFKGDDSEKLSANHVAIVQTFKNEDDGNYIFADLANFDVVESPLSNCAITRIEASKYNIKDYEVKIAKDIALGESTNEDVLEAFGNPTDSYESEVLISYTYSEDFYHAVKLIFDCEDGNKLISIEVENQSEPENFDKSEVDSSDVPEIVTKYETPSEISDDPMDYELSYAGDVYKLPVPVSKMLENGWEYVNDEGSILVGSRNSEWVELKKDGQSFKALAYNPIENSVYMENCFITELRASVHQCDVDMEIVYGIKSGMKESSLLKALEGKDYVVDDSSNFATEYNIEDPDSKSNGYNIRVVDGKIEVITVEHYLRNDDLAKFYNKK